MLMARITGRLGRLFGEGEPWLRWGVSAGRVAGFRVRIHWLFVVYVVASLIFTLPLHQSGLAFRLPALIALLLLVFCHELAHGLVCRAVGGEADEMVLWPLGGLAWCRPPADWRAELKSAVAGPMFHLVLFPWSAAALYMLTGSIGVAFPNPFNLTRGVFLLRLNDGTTPLWLITLWSFHAINTVLLLANTLIPMFPLDGARVLQCLIWRRRGYHRSLWLTPNIGLVASCVMAVVGAVFEDGKPLILLGAFGAAVCWAERRRYLFLAGSDEPEPPPIEPVPDPQPEVDLILEKISRVGMNGLSARERRVLKRATERSRETEDERPVSDR